MALHAKLLKHNILRVSRLKRLSHTTQAIEKSTNRSVSLCSTREKALADEGQKLNLSDGQQLDYWSSPIWITSFSYQDSVLQSSQPSLILQELLALPSQQFPVEAYQKYQERELCHSSHFNLDLVTSAKLKNRERGLTAMLFPQDNLPFIIKPVSYTTDDIMACPVEWESNHSIISRKNHAVTVLTQSQFSPENIHLNSCLNHQQGSVLSKQDEDCKGHFLCECDSSSLHFEAQCVETQTLFHEAKSDLDIVLYSSGSQDSSSEKQQGPNLDQLRAVETYFIETLPSFFKSRMDFRIYHPEVVLENNFWGENEVSVGINRYALQMAKIRVLSHLKYAHVHMEVVSSACIPEESVIRIQWRIMGLSQLKALRFWKYTAWGYRKSLNEDSEWFDGISILHINKDGLVVKHRIDRVTPDDNQAVKTPSLAVKMSLLLGLSAPKEGLSDFSTFL